MKYEVIVYCAKRVNDEKKNTKEKKNVKKNQ